MSNTRLWDYFDGEPFMENPRLGILALGNKPRKKKGRKGMAKRRQPAGLRKYWATHRRKGQKHAAPKRRRRARRNWTNTGAMANPRRKHHRRRGYRTSAKRRRRQSYRRNPYRQNPVFLGLSIPPVRSVAFGIVGFAAPPLVQGFLTSLAPSIMQQATNAGLIGKYAVKVGSVMLTSWLTHRFVSASDGNAVMVGGGINIGLSLVNDFAPGFLPANPLSAYVPIRPGMRAYVPTRPGLRAVPQPQRMLRSVPTAANVGSGPFGPAIRYQRY